MNVELLHTNECHIWKKALEILSETLEEEGIKENVKVTEIKSVEEANQRKFSGSPQIIINGKDVDPMAEKITNYMLAGCRQYFYKGQHSEFPPKEIEALNKNKE